MTDTLASSWKLAVIGLCNNLGQISVVSQAAENRWWLPTGHGDATADPGIDSAEVGGVAVSEERHECVALCGGVL
jgi:hypothetical protein